MLHIVLVRAPPAHSCSGSCLRRGYPWRALALFVQEEEKWDNFLEQLSNTRKLSAQEKANLGRSEKKAYKRERNLLFGLIGAVVFSFSFSLISLLKPLFTDTDQTRLTEIEQKLKVLELENKELKDQVDSIQFLYTKKSK